MGDFDATGYKVLAILAGIVFVVVALRLVWIQVVDAGRLSQMAENSRTNVTVIHAKRGTIYDRNGNVLAISVDCDTIVCDPTMIEDADSIAAILAEVLGGEKDDYTEPLTRENTRYAKIAEQVDTSVADDLEAKLDEAGLDGIFFEGDTKRVYPYGNTAAQILGFVSKDGEALSGLEYYYNDILTGTNGQRVYEASKWGTPIAGGISETYAATNGTDIVISLDIDLQYECEEIIAKATETYSADSGSVMVIDPKTGEIAAAASTPMPDFSNITDSSSLSLKLVSDSYEPGSIFKVITTSIGLEDGTFTKDTTMTIPAEVLVGDDYVHDDDGRDYDTEMSVEYALTQSSNTAMAYYVQELIGAERFAEGVAAFGIGQKTGIDFPGESSGIVKSYEDYDGSTAGSMSFGQGLAVPLVQVVRAYATVANDGVPTTPHFLVSKAGEEVEWPEGDQVISKKTADEETEMMVNVMEEGTGENGKVDGYVIAGKTGTGEQADESGGYVEGKYVASLCGFANADDPEVVVYVGLNGIPYLAAVSAANVFHDVMQQSVTILGVAPAAQ